MCILASAAERGQFSRPHSGELLLSRYVPITIEDRASIEHERGVWWGGMLSGVTPCCEVLGEIEQLESDRATWETDLMTGKDFDGGALTAVPQMTE